MLVSSISYYTIIPKKHRVFSRLSYVLPFRNKKYNLWPLPKNEYTIRATNDNIIITIFEN